MATQISINERPYTIVAGLSSTVINRRGTYEVEVDLAMPESLAGVPHYVGHPSTKAVLDSLGAEKVAGLFGGLEVGESFLAFPIVNPRGDAEWTLDRALASRDELRVTLVTRIA